MRIRLRHDRLVRLIAESNISQNHWAMKVGLSRGHWSEIVNGKHPYLSPKSREKLLEGLKLSFDELFEVEAGDSWTHQSGAEFQSGLSELYIVDKEIGQGGMGTVYLAREVKHGRLVAIKVISPEAVSGVGVQQFLKELRYTAALEHPNILTLLDSGEAAGYPYYVMPYIRGGSLNEYLRERGPLSPSEALPLVYDVALALDHAHSNRIIHCDVKPANILLAPRHAYVADFGISRTVHAEAREWQRRGQLDSSAGTPAYVSPEQASGETNLDGRTDVYSLGCVVYQMLTGHPPFSGSSTMEIVSKRFTDAIPNVRDDVPELPYSVAAVVERAMSLDPRRRHDKTTEFAEDFDRATTGQRSVVARISLASTRIHRAVRRTTGGKPDSAYAGRRFTLMLSRTVRDLAFAVRSFAKNPGFTLTAIITLALGVGANSAIFTVVNSALFKKSDVVAPGELVEVYRLLTDGRHFAVSHRDIRDITEGVPDQLVGISGYKFFSGQVAEAEQAGTLVLGQLVGGNYFDLHGVSAALGRTFLPEEDVTPETHPVVILGDRFWRTRFGSDPEIIGRNIRLNGRQYTVVGVAPRSFPGRLPGVPTDVWVPMMMENHLFPSSLDNNNLNATARLAPGVDADRLTAAFGVLSVNIDEARGRSQRGWELFAAPFEDVVLSPSLDGALKAISTLLLVVVGMVLLVTCTNLASFLLARATDRRKEMAIRMAMGASRNLIVRQLMTEALLLAVVGGIVGLITSVWVVDILLGLDPPVPFPLNLDASIDWRVLAYTLGITVVASVMFGLLPALKATKTEIAPTLREEAGNIAGGRTLNLRGMLVVLQIALSLVLLVGSGLFVRSLRSALDIDVGFSTDPAGIVTVDLRGSGYEADEYPQLYRRLLAGAEALPNVRSVSVSNRLPVMLLNWQIGITVPGAENSRGGNDFSIETSYVSPGYFDVLGIPMRTGRSFTDTDAEGGQLVAIFNETAASRFWPDQDPIGRTIRIGDDDVMVVGVAANAKDRGLRESPRPMLFVPMMQRAIFTMTIVARGTAPAGLLAEDLRRMALGIDPSMFVVESKTMSDHLGVMYYLPRMAALLVSVFAGLALVLGCIGLYGVVSYSVSRRAREMAIRMSLGAKAQDVVKLVLKNGMTLVLIGAVIGLISAFGAARLLERFLIGVDGFDPATFISVPLVLAAVALLAAWIPARRASRVSPMEAMRAE